MLTTSLNRKLLFFLAISFYTESLAQEQWGDLKPGPFSIGYKTLQLVDHSRRYFEAGRPLQVYVWYPARTFEEKDAMEYDGYFDDIGKDWGTYQDTKILRDDLTARFTSGALNPSFPGTINGEQFEKILQTKIPVKRHAANAPGKFPVILHVHAQGALTQSVMLEYLASHGYIVMSISMYGSSPAFYGRGEGTASELLDLTQDLAFVLGEAREIPGVDSEKTALVGMLSHLGLTLQSKTKGLSAIACLDCFWNPNLVKQIPYYDPVRITTPILEVLNTDYASGRPTFVDSLRYAERYVVRFKKLPHADFYPFPRIARPGQRSANANYDVLMELTANFLDATLKKKPEAIEYMTGLEESENRSSAILSFRRELAEVAPPTEHEFLTWLRYGNMEQAKAAWQRYGKMIVSESNFFFVTLFLAKEDQPHAFEVFDMYMSAFPSSPRNIMLYEHLSYNLTLNQPEQTLKVCKKWIEQFPDSPYAYRAIAEVHVVRGKHTEAIRNLTIALDKAAGLDQSAETTRALIQDLRKRLDHISEK